MMQCMNRPVQPGRHGWLIRTPTLVTGNYVLVESCALIQARLGMEALLSMRRSSPWFSPLDHTGRSSAGHRCSPDGKSPGVESGPLTSFQIMRRLGRAECSCSTRTSPSRASAITRLASVASVERHAERVSVADWLMVVAPPT